MKTINYKLLLIMLISFIFLQSAKAQCIASFNYVDNGNGVITLQSTSDSIYNVWWQVDSNFISYGDITTITLLNGTYEICMFIEDSATSCYDNICQTIVVNDSTQNCLASFTYTDDGNGTFTFTNTSGGGLVYDWNFDGLSGYFPPIATSSMENPTYTYSTPGTYYVSLYIYDTINNCSDSIAQQIVFQDSISCDIVAGFTFVDNGNGNFSFINTSTSGSTLLAQWNFGDGGSSNTYNANHTFTANGTFVVVLAAIGADSNQVLNNCIDYYTVTITVSGVSSPVACNAAFVMYTDSSYNGVMVVNSSTGSNLNYFWDFGDGNTSIQAYPNYTYTSTGPFELCLTVSDSIGCTSTYCDSISDGGIILKQAGFTINVVSPSSTLSINDNFEIFSDINVYPNPAKELLNIDLSLLKNATVELFVTDITGKVVAQIANNENQVGKRNYQWNVGGLQNGIYFLNIKTDNTLQVKKVMINR